jgi:hypothetical protein
MAKRRLDRFKGHLHGQDARDLDFGENEHG